MLKVTVLSLDIMDTYILSAILLGHVFCGVCGQEPLVEISQGAVRGIWSDDRSYAMYMGIPYARVDPKNPFGAALPAPTFKEVFNANNDSTMCPQFKGVFYGTINCLDLNVYVPSTASIDKTLPVMVWIYGGGFNIGAAGRTDFGPQYLVRHDIILVTVNYRLGVYGWMCLDTPSVPGNNGLKDIRTALRWINKDIAAFGGDNTSITLFGESAGGFAVEYLILSPSARNLFHRAILESGSALSDTATKEHDPNLAIQLSKYFGHHPATTEEAISILKDISPDKLLEASRHLDALHQACVEKKFEGVESIVNDYPENIMSRGDFQDIPLLAGYNNYERIFVHWPNKHKESYYVSNKDLVLNTIKSVYNFSDDEILREVSRIVNEFYFGADGITKDNLFNLIFFDSDWMFFFPAERSIRYHLAHGSSPVYQYVFAYIGKINYMRRPLHITEGGASHTDELGYLFTQTSVPRNDTTPEDQLMIDRMTTMWTNFAKYSNPTPNTTSLLPVIWKPASENRSFLWIDSELKLKRKPFHRRVALWDLVFQAYRKFYRRA